jgi:MFS superfamily sulfate permease-like transporter
MVFVYFIRSKLDYGLAVTGVYVIQLQGRIFFGNIQKVCRSVDTT